MQRILIPALIKAAVDGNTQTVEQYLREQQDAIKFAIELAVQNGHTAIVSLLTAAMIENPKADDEVSHQDGLLTGQSFFTQVPPATLRASEDPLFMPTRDKSVNFLNQKSNLNESLRMQALGALENINPTQGCPIWQALGNQLFAERRLAHFQAARFQGAAFKSEEFLNLLSAMNPPFTLGDLVQEYRRCGIPNVGDLLAREMKNYESKLAEIKLAAPKTAPAQPKPMEEVTSPVTTLADRSKFDNTFRLQILGALEIPYQGQPFWRTLGDQLYAEGHLTSWVYTRFMHGGMFRSTEYLQLLSAAPCNYTLHQLAQAMIYTQVKGLETAGQRLMEIFRPAVISSDFGKAGGSGPRR
jgi:hypothetical protein